MKRAATAVLVLAAVAALCGCGSAPPPVAPETVYMAGPSQLVAVDAVSLTERAPLALPGRVAAAVYDAKRGRLELMAAGVDQWITVDARAWRVIARRGLGMAPASLRLAHDGDHVYLTGSLPGGAGRLEELDLVSGQVTGRVAVGAAPAELAFNADQSRVAVANHGASTLSVLATAGLKPIRMLRLKAPPTQVVGLPYGNKVFALCGDLVAVVDVDTAQVLTYLPVGPRAQAMVVKPDGGEVYVSNAAGTVSVIDTATNEISGTMAAGVGAGAMAVAADGSALYVANAGAGTISVLNLADRTMTAVVQVGEQPDGLELASGGRYVFAADPGAGDLAVVRSNLDPTNPNTLVTLLAAPPRPRLLLAAPTP